MLQNLTPFTTLLGPPRRDQVINRRCHDQRQQHGNADCPDHRDCQRTKQIYPASQRQHSQSGREAGHQHWPQSPSAGLQDCLTQIHAAFH